MSRNIVGRLTAGKLQKQLREGHLKRTKEKASFRPRLEALEDRLAPSVFTVNSTGDTGTGTGLNGDLRYCITQANNDAGTNTIQFDRIVFNSPQTITLTSLLPAITDNNLSIAGPGANRVTISGNHLFQVFDIPAANITLRGLAIANGKATNGGGGIAFTGAGTLALSFTVISGNSAMGNGGGLYNLSGTVSVTNSTFSRNSATDGGGIFTSGGSLALGYSTLSSNSATNDGGGIGNGAADSVTLTGSNLSGNSAHNGGGIYNVSGDMVTLTNSALSGNSATSGNGGGISTASGSTLIVTSSTLSGNSAAGDGGGIWNGGTVTLTNSTLATNSATAGSGGGISTASGSVVTLTNSTLATNSATAGNGGGISTASGSVVTVTNSTLATNSAKQGVGGGIVNGGGMVTLTDSTLSQNSAKEGGGILSGGKLTLTDSTLSGNSATFKGGGIYSRFGTLTLTNCTLSGDSAATGGGIYNRSGSVSYLDNTLVAGNTASSSAPDVGGALKSTSGFNLIGDGTGATGISNGVNGNQIGTSASPINPHLSALGSWVGLTQTMVPLPGSPALDAGSNALDGGVTTDQRGLPRIFNGTVDIGAAEFRGPGQSTLTVNSTADDTVADTVLTLREALDYLTSNLGRLLTPAEQAQVVGDPVNPTTIQFDPTVFGSPQTITLTSALPADTFNNLTITGPGANLLTVSGNQLYQVLNITAANASISGLTIAKGNSGSGGGVFFNGAGTLALANMVISGNSAYGSGGGIYNHGKLMLTNSTLSGNSTNTALGKGGGISNHDTLTLTNSTLSGNSAGRYGGGIYNGGTVTLTNSTLSGNNGGSDGGGICNFGTLTLTNSALSGNSATFGAGIDNYLGTATVTDCTLSRNSAYSSGAGIYNQAVLTLVSSTLSGNSSGARGGGIYNGPYTSLELDNTLIAGNTAKYGGPDVHGAVNFTSQFNLIGDGTQMTGIWNGAQGNKVGTSKSPINPLLATLGNYGGPTQTLALLPGSPALDSGSNSLIGGATTDQRGDPRIVGGTVDIGAFESRGFTITISGGNHQSTVVNTAFASALTVTVSSVAGEPVAGGIVKFTPPSSGARAFLSSRIVTLNGSGKGSVTATANKVAGSYQVSVSAGGANASSQFSLTNRPGAPTQFTVLPSTATPTAGVAFSLTVTALDAFGNQVSAYRGTVHFTSSDTASLLPADYTFTSTDQGRHAFTVTLNTVGPETVTATDKARAAIKGTAQVTVQAAALLDHLAANGSAGADLTRSILDLFFAEEQREWGTSIGEK